MSGTFFVDYDEKKKIIDKILTKIRRIVIIIPRFEL